MDLDSPQQVIDVEEEENTRVSACKPSLFRCFLGACGSIHFEGLLL